MSAKSVVSTKLKNNIKVYLAKRALLAKEEAELKALKALKASIDADLDIVAKQDGFQNGRLGLPSVAMISVVMNPPKLVWQSGDALTPADREGLSLLVPEKFVIQSLRTADVFRAVERGTDGMAGILANKAIQVVQDSRYDIKPA